MKVALIGYGKMGHSIESILAERGHEVTARFGRDGIDKQALQKADVAIEFTRPEGAFGNIAACFECSVPVVSGTTGWLARYDEAVKLCEREEGTFLYASNFSLGVNLFFEVNRHLARIMNAYPEYEVDIEEIHHTEKKDAPSGTAITLAEQIEDQLKRKEGWTMDEQHSKEQIHISAKREPDVPGTHIIRYLSEIDTIQIEHTAHSRKGFALGAVLAAEFLPGKKGVYTMKDVLKI
ncbi:MAG: 4-hydroxy-tetrahydrodipicolinate reductase [Owenweeksia sp.]|nr:4-hydroxy-tetrahydrodipicolinate reductase [Owenweeksia sp.]MBF99691.1 4-hydroxy-tetrahydrodipicolinate reductase [Owenweeksia sp.]HBF18801.1 4-hydroxy-tetrahydrodipicolinate reductase [Cryomorphaceae bacterium]HCQ16607.1 4-hydroxy-tetrahydrodipicolinate reductase [Cryomorphaceae bacterium]|tara:strand:+ start:5383 stop:6090 length:708 start_codon:yes stop_codon:yes gene_type:complete